MFWNFVPNSAPKCTVSRRWFAVKVCDSSAQSNCTQRFLLGNRSRLLCGNDTVAVAMHFAMKNGQICFSLRKFLAISPAIHKIASDCGCDAVVHLALHRYFPEFLKGAQTMKCKLWTETLEFSRLKVPNSRFALHGKRPSLIHGLCAFFASNSQFMRTFQAALDTCLDSPFFASLSVHGLHFTVYAPSTTAWRISVLCFLRNVGSHRPKKSQQLSVPNPQTDPQKNNQGKLKGTELRWQRAPKTLIFAENRRFSQIHPFSWKFQHFEGAGNRRKPKIFADWALSP